MFKKIASKNPYLILGKDSALYSNCMTKETRTIKSPQEISQIKEHPLNKAIDVYIDFSEGFYGRYSFPKLSRFELKQALKNHPDLQGQNDIAASATLTANKEISLWRLPKNPLLLKWLEALSNNNTPLKSIQSLPMQHAPSLPSTTTKALYWIAQTPDHRARHVCIIESVIAFVRYTSLNKNIQNEIKETLHFIQRDYAINCTDITTLNDLNAPPILPTDPPQNYLSWLWLEHLPKKLSVSLIALKRIQRNYRLANIFKTLSLGLLILSGMFLVTESIFYYRAHTQEKGILEASKSLPKNVQNLSRQQREHLLFLAHNSQTPFQIISMLQQQNASTFRLEELHWRALNATQQRLNIAIRRQGNLSQKDRSDHLQHLFKQAPTLLPVDQQVDRFELIFTTGEHDE